MSYNNLIDVNIAPLNATKIGVYDSNENKVGKIELGNLKKTGLGNKLYSFGAISDIHYGTTTCDTDFQEAVRYFNEDTDAEFICIAGDLTADSVITNFEGYKAKADVSNIPVYAITGNHDCYGDTTVSDIIENYTGHQLYYTIEKENDLFVLFGCATNTRGSLFTAEQLQWLYETLEENRNKRVFLFQHSFINNGGSGDANDLYNSPMLLQNEETIFKELLSHYKNVLHFHGHSHLRFHLQELDSNANISKNINRFDIHIPSIGIPRDLVDDTLSTVHGESEGYLVDVYENGIVLRGRDFITKKFLPIAQYYLDTTLQTIDANTYTDSTGKIDTSTTYAITNNLTNAINSNSATSVIKKGSYSAIITPSVNYNIQSIKVTMGGVDITSSCVTDNNISIESVTGDVVITVTTVATVKTYNITNNLTNAINNNSSIEIEENTSYNATITPSSMDYSIDTITVSMSGADITSSCVNGNSINIDNVTGDIVITVTTKDFAPTYTFAWDNTQGTKLYNSENSPINGNMYLGGYTTATGETSNGTFVNSYIAIHPNKANFAVKTKVTFNYRKLALGLMKENGFFGIAVFNGAYVVNSYESDNRELNIPINDFLNVEHDVELIYNSDKLSIKIDGTKYEFDTWADEYSDISKFPYLPSEVGIGSGTNTTITPIVAKPHFVLTDVTKNFVCSEFKYGEWD